VLVALFAVFAAPRLKSRFGTARSLYVNFALLAADLAVIGIWPGKQTGVIVAVIVAGAFLGVTNTLVTSAAMSIASVERPVASATCGFVRFIGGGPAPYAAARLVEHKCARAVLDRHRDDRGVFAVSAAAAAGAVAAGGAVAVLPAFVVGVGEAEGVGVGE
jgi:hypothetical protein